MTADTKSEHERAMQVVEHLIQEAYRLDSAMLTEDLFKALHPCLDSAWRDRLTPIKSMQRYVLLSFPCVVQLEAAIKQAAVDKVAEKLTK